MSTITHISPNTVVNIGSGGAIHEFTHQRPSNIPVDNSRFTVAVSFQDQQGWLTRKPDQAQYGSHLVLGARRRAGGSNQCGAAIAGKTVGANGVSHTGYLGIEEIAVLNGGTGNFHVDLATGIDYTLATWWTLVLDSVRELQPNGAVAIAHSVRLYGDGVPFYTQQSLEYSPHYAQYANPGELVSVAGIVDALPAGAVLKISNLRSHWTAAGVQVTNP